MQWRVTFYVAGSADVGVENFFMLLDDFFTFKSKSLAKDIEIHVRPHKSAAAEVTSDLVESLSYEHLTFHEATAESNLPLKMFEAQPVVNPIILNYPLLNSKGANFSPSTSPFYEVGKRVVTMFIQPESGTHVSVLLEGNTLAFRAALDEAELTNPF